MKLVIVFSLLHLGTRFQSMSQASGAMSLGRTVHAAAEMCCRRYLAFLEKLGEMKFKSESIKSRRKLGKHIGPRVCHSGVMWANFREHTHVLQHIYLERNIRTGNFEPSLVHYRASRTERTIYQKETSLIHVAISDLAMNVV